MATDEVKKQNMVRLTNLTLFGVTTGIWDFVGETSLALSPKIGQEILNMMEKEMGLEIAGEKAADVLNEIARLFVDEFGFAAEIVVDEKEQEFQLTVNKCINRKLTNQLSNAGVEMPFICPIMNAAIAALKRMNIRVRHSIESNPKKDGSIITFELF